MSMRPPRKLGSYIHRVGVVEQPEADRLGRELMALAGVEVTVRIPPVGPRLLMNAASIRTAIGNLLGVLTGAVTDGAVLDELLAAARRHDTLLLSDECYADVYEPEHYPDGPPSILQYAGPEMSGVLGFFSLSKRSGMTGYRSGAIVGDAEAIAALRTLRTATGTASPEFVQAAAVAAWSETAAGRSDPGRWVTGWSKTD